MKVAAIIPAYNEENRIGDVLDSVIKCPLVSETIVVDDGSSDKTAEVASTYNSVQVLRHQSNRGKGAALKTGVEATDAEILLFVDADLIGLKPDHINELVEPLIEDKELAMTTSRFARGRPATNISQRLAPILNSQRAVRRSFLETVPDFSQSGFGVETIITKHARRTKAKVKQILLEGVGQIMKEEKFGLLRGARDRLKMYKDIVKHL
jgi:glycosyltransferase involved in cell wall biosynthesis